jgi:hypothetical protein
MFFKNRKYTLCYGAFLIPIDSNALTGGEAALRQGEKAA